MNCGPYKGDCASVLAEVWLLLDHECSGEQRAKLEEHLDTCRSCLEQYGVQEQLKALLARKCGGEHASAGFKDRLRARIQRAVFEQTDIVVEHGSSSVSVEVSRVIVERPDASV